MRTRALVVGLGLTTLWMSGVLAQVTPPVGQGAPVLVLETAKGTIEIELSPTDAPKSVAHILALVRRGFYRGLRFHWVQPSVIQVGDPQTRSMTTQSHWGLGDSGTAIGVAELNKRSFDRGTVGLAHRGEPKEADSQVFIIRSASPNLNGKYAMIGRVTKGMDVADKIEMADILKLAYVKGETPR
jgi:peptidylprolyl isomerase